MLSITNTNGRKIARIEGGIHNGRYIYLVNNIEGSDVYMEININDGILQIMPNKKVIEKIYISATSGSGKSFLTGKLVNEYLKQHIKNDYYVISSIKDDKSLDKYDPIRIEINQELFDDPIHPEELKDSIVVFDDTDVIVDPVIRGAINGLRDSILECGRHYRTTTIITSHLLLNRKETKRIINEATSIIFFPNSGSKYAIKRYLKDHLGLGTNEIKKLLKIKSRWISINTHDPQFIVWEKGAMMLSALNDEED